MSVGEDRVRLTFNPSMNPLITNIKEHSADLISNCLDHAKLENDPEAKRLWILAATEYENACMWAVKAFTAEVI